MKFEQFSVIPNVMGICLYSPLLDAMGNSVRGVQFCEELVKVFEFQSVIMILFSVSLLIDL